MGQISIFPGLGARVAKAVPVGSGVQVQIPWEGALEDTLGGRQRNRS